VAGRVRLTIAVVSTAAVLAGIGFTGASAGTALAAAGKGEGARISLRHTSHGMALVGANGHSLYTFTSDTHNHSNCSAACRAVWPPVTSSGKPAAGAGVSARHLGVIKGRQVTYYGHPLYTYVKDSKAGQTKGETLFKFGGYWYLSSAKGKLL
jgi:predicted lipoprotein with Yx(FWY)xxD motif